MTKEQIRVAVAEAAGWTVHQTHRGELILQNPTGYPVRSNWDMGTTMDSFFRDLPNYPEDLNACAEFEKQGLKNINDLAEYANQLEKICVPVRVCSLTHWAAIAMATAEQRCEAFLRMKGKWVE